jgi:hypothetical protein
MLSTGKLRLICGDPRLYQGNTAMHAFGVMMNHAERARAAGSSRL